MIKDLYKKLDGLKENFAGEILTGNKWKILYSTDASAYKEEPIAVTFPKNKADLKKLIFFANDNKTFLIPRTAGTSLAGQVVGNGVIVDVSKYFTKILEFNAHEHWVKVEPGVVLDELNLYTSEKGLFFGPETSTANRCMIGGMVGNNACGAHSLIYGSTRDHLLELEVILRDGSEITLRGLTKDEFIEKAKLQNSEGRIYSGIYNLLNNPEVISEIVKEYPAQQLKRRNTGYAIDLLVQNNVFNYSSNEKFNFCKLIAGSEGTLAFITSVKLNLIPLPPKEKGLICIHFKTLEEALKANLIALKYNPGAIELIDDVILKCTEANIDQKKNRFFVQGNPAAIIIIEFARESKEEIIKLKEDIQKEMEENCLGYHFPILFNNNINKVWALRKAGLGLLSNFSGDAKPVSVIEDTAVLPEFLPDYIKDIKSMLSRYNLDCVYHAHIATGELHLRPVLDLKSQKDVDLFYKVAEKTAHLVKKYKGSLSGEHGDGRLRGQFIPIIIGKKNYELLKKVKDIWDPNNIFNSGKIVDTPSITENLRYLPGSVTPEYQTIFDFSDVRGIMRMIEKCNGSGDCRKSELIGGTMCPSYMATRDEDKTTRSRANMLREILSNTSKKNPFNNKELYKILDLCLSCKGCKNECPSNVDMAKLKAEFLHQYYKSNRIPLRTLAIAYVSKLYSIGALFPGLFNKAVSSKLLSLIITSIIGFSKRRQVPLLHKITWKKWLKQNVPLLNKQLPENSPEVYLFIDEFTNYNDTAIGIKAAQILNKLGYKINFVNNTESGRTYISKGLLGQARKKAEINVNLYNEIITYKNPLIGIEPSAILTFRDEYPDLLRNIMKEKSLKLAQNTFMFDEFIVREYNGGNLKQDFFTGEAREILLHGHCQQKAMATIKSTIDMLSIPVNYKVNEIKSGCCGMAGSFGYEKEHYGLSMKIGELVLFPEIRKAEDKVLISAPGTSCRHHITDGTGKKALHPVEILYEALLDKEIV